MEPRGDRLAGLKGRVPEASARFLDEPMARLAVADVSMYPNDVVHEALAVEG